MDPFHLCLALGPLSVYLLVIGRINLARRPFVTTGARDAFALAIATLGLFVAGPLELFLPDGAVANLGPWVWLVLIGFYTLSALLIALLMRPRLMIYNISAEQLHPVLEEVASGLDAERRWAGRSLLLPHQRLQLVVETVPTMRHIQLVAVGDRHQDLRSWRRLELALRAKLGQLRVPPNPRGWTFLLSGIVLALLVLLQMSRQPEAVVQAMDQFLWR